MMRIQKISIPKPCHQSWQQMTIVENGRHCENCCKTVMDFTLMSNEEIIDYLSVTGRVCGRFSNEEFLGLSNRIADSNKKADWRKMFMTIAFLGASVVAKAGHHPSNAMVVETEQLQHSKPLQGQDTIKKENELTKYCTINGRVVDEANLPIPGAAVMVQGTTIGMVTDADGRFSLKAPFAAKVLLVRFIGYENNNFTIEDTACDNDIRVIKMKPSRMLMGEVVVIRQPFFKRVYYRFIKKPIGKMFGS